MKHLKLIFLVFICLNSFAQTEWFPLGAKWYYTQPGSTIFSPQEYITLEVEKDTLLNNQEYRLLSFKNMNNVTISNEFFREDNGKVYYWNYEMETEHKLYDFTAKIGDTIIVHSKTFKPTTGFFKDMISHVQSDSLLPIRYKIDDIKDSLINNRIVKVQTVIGIDDHENIRMTIRGKNIEYIGNENFIFGTSNLLSLGGSIYSYLRCYQEFNFKVSRWLEECDAIPGGVNTSKIQFNSISFSPNPATDFIRLDVEGENNTIQILNTQGQVIYQEKSSEKIFNIHTQNFASGIYFVIVVHPNGTISKGKFVKM
jgi:hypothetical protein